LYIGVGGVGALEGLGFVLARPLLPRRPEVAGPLFSALVGVRVDFTGRKRSGSALKLTEGLTSAALMGSTFALVERLSR
jgi:hypothetical protein